MKNISKPKSINYMILAIFILLNLSSCEKKDGTAKPIIIPPVITTPVELTPGTWSDIFVDNFDNGGNLSKWNPAIRADYNSANCMYVTSANSIKELDGKSSLCITAVKVSEGKFQSGNLETKDKFMPGLNEEYRFSASIKLLAQNELDVHKGFSDTYGAWPAFWTVEGDGWPTKGEIDIMEAYSYGPNKATKMGSNLFYGTTPMVNLLNNKLEKHANYTEGWHTFEMLWKNSSGNITVTTILDGATIATYTNASMSPELQLQNFSAHRMVLNLNVGDNFGIFDNSKINLFSKTMMFVDFAKIEKRIYK